MKEFVGILHNIRSIYNVASIFRTADGAGVSKLFLCGITPGPLDRFGAVREQFKKVSLGAERSVPWEYVSSTTKLLDQLTRDGYVIYALEQHTRATPYKKIQRPKSKKCAVVVGNEVRGISKGLLSKADRVIEIPMHGEKESLNVSVAFGIAVYHFLA